MTQRGAEEEEEEGAARTDLSDFNVILRRRFTQSSQIRVLGTTVGEQITATHMRNTVITSGGGVPAVRVDGWTGSAGGLTIPLCIHQ